MSITNQNQVRADRIIEFGVTDKESAFVKFETKDGPYTWYGSFNGTVNPGKKMSARDVTLQTMSKLGWSGDIDAFCAGMPCFNLPEGVDLVVGDDEYAPGKIVKDKVLKIYVPGFGGGKMEEGKAKSLLSGMKADIKKAEQAVALQKNDPGF